MSQHYGIEIHIRYIEIILRYYFQSLQEVYISYQSVEFDLQRRQRAALEWDVNNSQIIELLYTLELSVVDFDTGNNLTIEEPERVYF